MSNAIVSAQVYKLLRLAGRIDQYTRKARIFSLRQQPAAQDVSQGCCSSQMTYLWNELVREAWSTHRLLDNAERATKVVMKEFSSDPELKRRLASRRSTDFPIANWPEIRKILVQYKISPRTADFVAREMQNPKSVLWNLISSGDLKGLVERLHRTKDKFEDGIRNLMYSAHDLGSRHKALDATGSSSTIDCDETSDPETCKDIALVFIIVGTLIALINWLGGLDDPEDNKIRAEINSGGCPLVTSWSDDVIAEKFKKLFDQATYDEDEDAMLTVLNCLPCDRVAHVIELVGLDKILWEFDGTEWDDLVILLQKCKVLSFSDWDDDATRKFIFTVDCATINALSLSEIRQLMLNLFAGGTGDEDELAILKVFNCLPHCKIIQLLALPDMSPSDFDDEVDGEEWDKWQDIFIAAASNCPTGVQS